MEIQKLIYFLAAARTQNFNRAAEICMVAQPVLSRQIAALEKELGLELFRRHKKRVTLTEVGQEFSIYIKEALGQLQEAQQVMSAIKVGERGTVSVGCVEPMAADFLPSTLIAFNRLYPDVRLQISVKGPDEIMKATEQGLLDMGLLGLPSGEASSSETLMVQELYRDRMQLIIPPDHHLAQINDRPIFLQDIAEEPLVLLREGFGVRRVTERVLAAHGLSRQPTIEINSNEGVKEFVKQGYGVTILPATLIKPAQLNRELIVRPIADLLEEFSFVLVYRRFGAISNTARTVIKAILTQVKSKNQPHNSLEV